MDKLKYKPEYVLKNAIGFNEVDLEANREGHLSESQADQLRHKRSILLSVALTAIIVAIIPLSKQSSLPFQWTISGGLIAIVAISQLIPIWYVLSRNIVHMVEGRVHLDIGLYGRHRYILIIGSLSFPISKRIFLSFKNTDPYAVYYTSYSVLFTHDVPLFQSRKILSAEWINPKEIQ